MNKKNQLTSQMLEGSMAIAQTINNIKPAVVSAYPITPQTHIVENLADFKAKGEADYEYVRAESEFAAGSIVAGASASGVRVYTATSSQGLLLMTEVIFNIAGLRLPVVLTCANRAVSGPISIWNDQQDAMTVRDAGWIMLFAENHQEAVDQHIMAYKIAEQSQIPVMVNVDGFTITHSYEPVVVPGNKLIKKYLPDYKPKKETYLDPKRPITMGAFATPNHYMEIRKELHDDLVSSSELILEEYKQYQKIIFDKNLKADDNGLVEYTGPKKPETLIIAMGSHVGTVKEAIKEKNNIGILKIKSFRPFPKKEIIKYLDRAKNIAVLDKAISLGFMGPLGSEVKAGAQGILNKKITNFIIGLGGRDINSETIKEIITRSSKEKEDVIFMSKKI